jgi:hypothetical protein
VRYKRDLVIEVEGHLLQELIPRISASFLQLLWSGKRPDRLLVDV